jgi:nucleoid DNA-binding protein
MTKLNYTAAELKTAYQIVADHLFTELLKASEGQTVRLGALGKFTKRVRKTRMG